MSETQTENKRQYFRLKLETPICAELRIAMINGNPIKSGLSKVCIKDIGAGGVLFQTNLKFPVRDDFLLSFSMVIMDQPIEVYGSLLRCSTLTEGVYEYGIEFVFLEGKISQQELLSLLGRFQIAYKQKAVNQHCSMCDCKMVCYKNN